MAKHKKKTIKKAKTKKAKTKSAKQNTKNGWTIFGVIALVLICLASIFTIAYGVIYFQNPPTAVKTAYANRLTYADESQYDGVPTPLELNIYTNARQNGVECYELRINSYTDTTLPGFDDDGKVKDTKYTYGSGYQSIGVPQTKVLVDSGIFETVFSKTRMSLALTSGYTYNTSDGVSYKAINSIDSLDKYIFDYGFGDGLLQVYMRNDYRFYGKNALNQPVYLKNNLPYLINSLFSLAQDMTEGVYYINFDFSEFLNYKIYDTESKKFVSPQESSIDVKNLFLFTKITISNNGLLEAQQSLFDQIANDSNYSYDSIVTTDDYYKSLTLFTLEADDFDIIRGKAILKQSCYNYLSNFSKMYIQVVLDLDSMDCGELAYNAFRGLNIDEIVLYSSTEKTFVVHEDYNITTDNVRVEVIL